MKKLKSIVIVAFALILCASACKESKKAMSADKDKNDTEVNNTPNQPINSVQKVVVDPTYMAQSTDKFTLLESSIDGDILSLLVQYGGGCETHEWALKTNGAYAKSLPPQITLNLEHNANGDMCRALLTDTLEFDIKDIKYAGSFQLLVKIKDFEKHTITYRYN